jgi:uncharacterized membrane protein YfcA
MENETMLDGLELPLSATQILAGWAIIVACAWIQGSIGFGMGLVAAPFLYLLNPILVPGPLLICAMVLLLFMIRRDGRSVRWRELGWPLLGRCIGTVPAIFVLRYFTGDAFSIALGTLLLAAVAMSLRGIHFRPTPRNLLCAGSISGFMGATVAASGPAMALVYQHERGERLRGVLSWYFLLGGLVTVPAFYAGGRLGMPEILATLILAPAAPLGYVLSSHTFPHLEKQGLRPAVLALSALSGIAVILRGLL